MDYYRLTIPIPKQPWQWIRFRIVTLLLLVAIAALALAWQRDHRQLLAELDKYRNPRRSYDASQATGPPNVIRQGDAAQAWCPATPDGGQEWLILEFDKSLVPVAIVIHENYAPGAIAKVTHLPRFGKEQTLWQGTYTPVPGNAGTVATLPVTGSLTTNRIKVYLDTAVAKDWNEIDAVGIKLNTGKIIWAARAEASSVWGQVQSQIGWQATPGFNALYDGGVLTF